MAWNWVSEKARQYVAAPAGELFGLGRDYVVAPAARGLVRLVASQAAEAIAPPEPRTLPVADQRLAPEEAFRQVHTILKKFADTSRSTAEDISHALRICENMVASPEVFGLRSGQIGELEAIIPTLRMLITRVDLAAPSPSRRAADALALVPVGEPRPVSPALEGAAAPRVELTGDTPIALPRASARLISDCVHYLEGASPAALERVADQAREHDALAPLVEAVHARAFGRTEAPLERMIASTEETLALVQQGADREGVLRAVPAFCERLAAYQEAVRDGRSTSMTPSERRAFIKDTNCLGELLQLYGIVLRTPTDGDSGVVLDVEGDAFPTLRTMMGRRTSDRVALMGGEYLGIIDCNRGSPDDAYVLPIAQPRQFRIILNHLLEQFLGRVLIPRRESLRGQGELRRLVERGVREADAALQRAAETSVVGALAQTAIEYLAPSATPARAALHDGPRIEVLEDAPLDRSPSRLEVERARLSASAAASLAPPPRAAATAAPRPRAAATAPLHSAERRLDMRGVLDDEVAGADSPPPLLHPASSGVPPFRPSSSADSSPRSSPPLGGENVYDHFMPPGSAAADHRPAGRRVRPGAAAAEEEGQGWLGTLRGLIDPFLSGEGGGSRLVGGLLSMGARPVLMLLDSIIEQTAARDGERDQPQEALGALRAARGVVYDVIHGPDQTYAAYRNAFHQVWGICSRFPIIVGGIELPFGTSPDASRENPVQRLQELQRRFRENHSRVYNRQPATAEQTDAKIERLSQTGACFGTHKLCALMLGSPKDFPSFHEIILQTKAMTEEERKAHFLKHMRIAIEANVSANAFMRWLTIAFLPVIYWFSTFFSSNLGEGLRNYFRNNVIPHVKREDDKRLHSGAIAQVGKSFDDLNKMMDDWVTNPRGSAWDPQAHIREVKDRKVFNGERTAEELYHDVGEICVEEIMPKLKWHEQVESWNVALATWANRSDSTALQVFKHILVAPLRAVVWVFKYVCVVPVQWVMQSMATWGAKKAFVETNAVSNIIATVKQTRFEDTPYVPILDWVAERLLDIHQAQIRAEAVDIHYRSDPENQRTIRHFLDRAFAFVERWATDSRREMQKIVDGPQGVEGFLRGLGESILLPPLQSALVELIEIVQALATEEQQLESFLHEFCVIAEDALENEGKELTRAERSRRHRSYAETRELMESTLNAILWTVTLEATAEFGRRGTVEAARNHVNWLRHVFLGTPYRPIAIEMRERREDLQTLMQRVGVDTGAAAERGSPASLSEAHLERLEARGTMPRVASLPVLSGSSVDLSGRVHRPEPRRPGSDFVSPVATSGTGADSERALFDEEGSDDSLPIGEGGMIAQWQELLRSFADDPEENIADLDRAYHACATLAARLKDREVRLGVQHPDEPAAGHMTREHLRPRSLLVIDHVEAVSRKICRLHTLSRYHIYLQQPDATDILRATPVHQAEWSFNQVERIWTSFQTAIHLIDLNGNIARLNVPEIKQQLRDLEAVERRLRQSLAAPHIPLDLCTIADNLERCRLKFVGYLEQVQEYDTCHKIYVKLPVILEPLLQSSPTYDRASVIADLEALREELPEAQQLNFDTFKRTILGTRDQASARQALDQYRRSVQDAYHASDTALRATTEELSREMQSLARDQEQLTGDLDEANALFEVSRQPIRPRSAPALMSAVPPSLLSVRVAEATQACHQLGAAVSEMTHVDYIEVPFPSWLRAIGSMGMSAVQQLLYKQMSTRAMTLIEATCHPDVFEVLLRNVAMIPLVEGYRGKRTPSYATD